MDFSYSDEQVLLRDNLRSFLSDRYSFQSRRAAVQSAAGWRPELWRALADELGILGVADPVDTLIVMEELGRALVVEPFLETVVIGGALLARLGGERAAQMLAQIGAGKAILAFAWAEPNTRYDFSAVSTTAIDEAGGWRLDGAKSVVMAAPWATHLLVTARIPGTAGVSLFLADKGAAGFRFNDYPTIDGRRASDVALVNVKLPAEALLGRAGGALDAIEFSADAAIAAICAEAVGVLSKLQDDTVEYTKQRRQFGQPIAGFQALQHRMVDMYMELQMAQSATCLAALKLSAAPAERALAASAAKVTIGKACRFIGQNAVQLHGGMGMTDELAVSHYFKRATMIEAEFGSVDFHLLRYAALRRAA